MNEQSKPTGTGKNRIPNFASREEEAEFWDTHAFTDYLDELAPVKVHVAKPLTALSLRRWKFVLTRKVSA